MKLTTGIKTFLLLLTIITLAVAFQSCEDDPISGCTDVNAETYDPLATEADASACVYSREKFVGTYDGTFICPTLRNPLTGELLIASDSSYVFTIEEKASGEVNDLSVNLDIAGNAIALDATADGNDLLVNTTIEGVFVPQLNANVDLTVAGTATLDGSDLSGIMNVNADLNGLNIADQCPLDGTKR